MIDQQEQIEDTFTTGDNIVSVLAQIRDLAMSAQAANALHIVQTIYHLANGELVSLRCPDDCAIDHRVEVFAMHMGVSLRTVQRWIECKMPTTTEGKVPCSDAREWRKSNKRVYNSS